MNLRRWVKKWWLSFNEGKARSDSRGQLLTTAREVEELKLLLMAKERTWNLV